MFGAAPGATAPFATPPTTTTAAAEAPAPAPAPRPMRRSTSVRRSTSRSAASLVPFRDDSRLLALRYDETVAAEPPIPLPPPRSPLRATTTLLPPPAAAAATYPGYSSSSSFSSSSLVPAPLALRTPPPPRPPPPTEQHPALRTISTPTPPPPPLRAALEDIAEQQRRQRRPRVAALSASVSVSASSSTRSCTTCRGGEGEDGSEGDNDDNDDDDDDDDDPFAYEKISAAARALSISPSVYSEKQQQQPQPPQENEPRTSETYSSSSDPTSSPALSVSDGSSESPPSPMTPTTTTTTTTTMTTTMTPSPASQKKAGRGFSLRSRSSSKSSAASSAASSSAIRRLRKKSLLAPGSKMAAPTVPLAGGVAAGMHGTNIGGGPGEKDAAPLASLGTAASSRVPCPGEEPRPRPSWSGWPRGPWGGANSSHNAGGARGGASAGATHSPIISTAIPTDSFFEADFMSQLAFSKRGSLLFAGKRPRRSKMADDSDKRRQPRAFPLVPASAKKATTVAASQHNVAVQPASPSQLSAGGGGGSSGGDPTAAAEERGATRRQDHEQQQQQHATPPTEYHNHALPEAVAGSPTSPRARQPPSIRLISAEAEKESQKVRSLYESGEGLNWEDGQGERLAPTAEVPSDVDEIDAPPPPVQPGHPTLTSASILSLPDSTLSGDHVLAGGIEDWEGVSGRDVDRYGFILPHRPESRPASSEATSVKYSATKQRNVLVRRDPASHSMNARRRPAKKLSARSLHTQNSEVSNLSRRSARSAIRQASNLLPHNKDRRLVDDAGDVLSLEPGMANVAEDETTQKISAEMKRKEIERSDKWRKMAKVAKPGAEGQGMVFEFDLKHPKLAERTWKGIPDCWRSAAWYSFLTSSAKASDYPFVADEQLKSTFRSLLEEPSPDDTQIDLDVPRTINQHIMFRRRYRGGQRLLFRVLHALSLYFPKTGYVQGMATLAATFLSYYDEESCFVMLVRLWQHRGLNRIYQSGFEELMGALNDFETFWLGGKDVAEKLKELCIDPTAYATRWYLTLFNLSIPFPVQLRVWDVFMLLGSSPDELGVDAAGGGKEMHDEQPSSRGLEILHATSLAIMDSLRSLLLDSDFENAMRALTSWIPIKDEQRFLQIVHIEWKKHQGKQKKKN
ncbi:TBC domain-containing protein [Xylariaceae sp. FL0804]|nr:TBC domain-containing protein [Xylariaceae sp. FL0804]